MTRKMTFQLVAAGTDKWIKVTDLLWRTDDTGNQHFAQLAKVGDPESWDVNCSPDDVHTGRVKIAVARVPRTGQPGDGDYAVHIETTGVHDAHEPYPVDDAHLPIVRASGRAAAAS